MQGESRVVGVVSEWRFLSNHAIVLICLTREPDLTLRQIGDRVGLTERATHRIVSDLVHQGYLVRACGKALKGHFPEDLHIALVELMSTLIPEGAQVVFLGDGEFDGTTLQNTLTALGWSYVCRTAISTTATWEDETFSLESWGRVSSRGG